MCRLFVCLYNTNVLRTIGYLGSIPYIYYLTHLGVVTKTSVNILCSTVEISRDNTTFCQLVH